MKTKTATRRAMLLSLTSLLICAAMLIGTTYAWFTDSVTSGTNRIIAGNLDVELTHQNNGTAEEAVGATTQLFKTAFGGSMLWEPGAAAYETFTVKNVGTLALKYQLNLSDVIYNSVYWGTAPTTLYNLPQVIKLAVIPAGTTVTREAIAAAATQPLATFLNAGGSAKTSALEPGASESFTIALYWAPNANEIDNHYNLNNTGWTLVPATGENPVETNILYVDSKITLLATQQTSESDSFDNLYDETADTANGDFANAPAVAVTINDDTAATLSAATVGTDNKTVTASTQDTVISSAAATSTIPADTTFVMSDTNNEDVTLTDNDSVTNLSRTIETTESSAGSATYDISFKATVTTTGDNAGTQEYAVHEFSQIVSNEIYIGKELGNVQVTHSGVPMNKLTTNTATNNSFYYDAETGMLYIYSSTYSEYAVTWDLLSEVIVSEQGKEDVGMTLAAFRDSVNAGTSYAGCTVTLMKNVDLSGSNWTPIGTSANRFTGVFNGNGKTISGLTINDTSLEGAGLFGYVRNATLEDFNVEGANITAKKKSGIVCGFADETSALKNINVDSTSSITANSNVSGLVGYLTSATASILNGHLLVKDCTVSATVIGKDASGTRAAGFVGAMNGMRIIDFENCTFNGSVKGDNRSAQFVGIAQAYDLPNDCINTVAIFLNNCKANGTVAAYSENATQNGIVVGWTQYGSRHIVLNNFKVNDAAFSDYEQLIGYTENTSAAVYGFYSYNVIQADNEIVGLHHGETFAPIDSAKTYSYPEAPANGDPVVKDYDYALQLNPDFTLTYMVNKITEIQSSGTIQCDCTKYVGSSDAATFVVTIKQSGDNGSVAVSGENNNFYDHNGNQISVLKVGYTDTLNAYGNMLEFTWDSTLNGWRLNETYQPLYD